MITFTHEIFWRPTYSTRTCLAVRFFEDGEPLGDCGHTHSSEKAAQRCADKIIQDLIKEVSE